MLIAADEDSGECFIQTTSLDGERNLKPKLALKLIQDNLAQLVENPNLISISCPPPDRNLYHFKGIAHVNFNETKMLHDIELKHFLPRVRFNSF